MAAISKQSRNWLAVNTSVSPVVASRLKTMPTTGTVDTGRLEQAAMAALRAAVWLVRRRL